MLLVKGYHSIVLWQFNSSKTKYESDHGNKHKMQWDGMKIILKDQSCLFVCLFVCLRHTRMTRLFGKVKPNYFMKQNSSSSFLLKDKSPEVLFLRIASSYSQSEKLEFLRQFCKKQNMIKKKYQLNRNKKCLLTKPSNVLSFYTSSQNSNLLYSNFDSLKRS